MHDERRAQRAIRFIENLRHTKSPFNGQPFTLLPWQRSVIWDVYGTLRGDGARQFKYVYLEVPKKNGKALALDTKIPTPQGWKRMGDLQVGDAVFDERGIPCFVTAVSPTMTDRPCYRVRFNNGEELIADRDHQWVTTTRRPEAKRAIRTTGEIAKSIRSLNGLNHRIEIAETLQIAGKEFPLAPYVLGLWLGDGNSSDARITMADPEPLDVIRSLGYELHHRESFGEFGYWISGINPALRALNLLGNKHIPEIYLFGSQEQRLELLRGLMDSDGYCSRVGQCEYSSKSERLAHDVTVLVRSLGIKATMSEGRSSLYGKDCGPRYRVFFHPNVRIRIAYISRKAASQSISAGQNTRASRIYIQDAEPVPSVPVRCIQVDSPSRMYLVSESFIPTHNSELVAATALYHLFADGEVNGEVYGCAGDREQATLVYDVAVDMIEQVPALKKRAKVNDSMKRITDKISGTFYKVVSAEAYTKHGLNVSAVIFDELHVQPNRDLWDVMTKGAGATRRQPIWWVITTAGSDPDRVSIGWEVHDKAAGILRARETGDAEHDVPTWYPVIYGYQGEDIWNESNWVMANPSLGATFTIENMREEALEAKQSKADERLFRWLRLNQWTTTKLTGWLPLDLFDGTNGEWRREELLGKKCYLGLDLSTTTDLSALCLLFPPQEGLDEWRAIWECWIPAENMQERVHTDHVPYDQWAAAAWLTPTEGDVVDYTVIEQKILEAMKLYKVEELGADRSFAAMLLQRLEQAGLKCVDIPQQYGHLTDPMQAIEVLLRNKQITHEPNPVARWCFGNTSIAKNGNAQIKYVKEHKGRSVDRTKRIDLVAAWVCAMARAKFYESARSVYEDRGLQSIG